MILHNNVKDLKVGLNRIDKSIYSQIEVAAC